MIYFAISKSKSPNFSCTIHAANINTFLETAKERTKKELMASALSPFWFVGLCDIIQRITLDYEWILFWML